MSVINIENITKDYGNQKGVFNVSFTVEKGEILGFLGPNGAGKTTTIRQLLGFIKPDSGKIFINNLDCFSKANEIQKHLGYLPGEISFIEDMSGKEFIKFIAKMKNIADFSKALQLISYFDIDTDIKLKKMSKGMKQKIALICAFMANPEILILDEPTSGLDPLMQNKFIELILKEKENGKTILMSSHIFEEIEKTCDNAVIIKEGKIVAKKSIEQLKCGKTKIYDVTFKTNEQANLYAKNNAYNTIDNNKVSLTVGNDVNNFIKNLSNYDISDIEIHNQSLEQLFMQYYGGEK